MRRDIVLVVLTVAGSAFCWWPVTVEQNLNLPAWLPLIFVTLATGLSTILSAGRWLRFLVASGIGTFAGLLSGMVLWPPSDPIAGSYEGIVLLVGTSAAVLVSLVVALAIRKVSVTNKMGRRTLWIAVVCCVAFGPIALALTPPLVAKRIAHNDRIAAERFESLKKAVEQTWADVDGRERICDGAALKHNYSGPPFSESEWQLIAGNYVQQDGYVFGVYCHEKNGYTIDAWPKLERGYGTRHFCTDESGSVGCGMEWNRSRYACIPCGN